MIGGELLPSLRASGKVVTFPNYGRGGHKPRPLECSREFPGPRCECEELLPGGGKGTDGASAWARGQSLFGSRPGRSTVSVMLPPGDGR